MGWRVVGGAGGAWWGSVPVRVVHGCNYAFRKRDVNPHLVGGGRLGHR